VEAKKPAPAPKPEKPAKAKEHGKGPDGGGPPGQLKKEGDGGD
jgi:hypothetical protein